MNKKIVGIFAMTLLIAVSVLPVSGTLNNIQNNNSVIVQTDEDTGWIELDKIIASDGQMNEWFGYSVLIDGDYAIMGHLVIILTKVQHIYLKGMGQAGLNKQN